MPHPTTADAVVADLEDRGFAVTTADGQPVADGGDGDGITDLEAPLALEPITDTRPLTTVSAIANAAHAGHVPLLVVDDYEFEAVVGLVSPPFLLEDDYSVEGDQDCRAFVTIEDRILLTDDTYACVGTEGPIEWVEGPRVTTDSPSLELFVGGERVAVVPSVDALTCPGPSPETFRFRYTRQADGRFAVFEGDERRGRYPSVATMRRAGFRPLPLPLIPEHHVRHGGHLARGGVIAYESEDGVRYTPFG